MDQITYLNGKVKILERQIEIDELKRNHLLDRIKSLTICDGQHDLIRTIKRLNAANTSLHDHNGELQHELELARERIAELQRLLASK